MADCPQLGQRLQLISKCNIRYEGVLCAIDPDENTVKLQDVRMFGTEARDAKEFIAPSHELYLKNMFFLLPSAFASEAELTCNHAIR